jgi:hypothetical protein
LARDTSTHINDLNNRCNNTTSEFMMDIQQANSYTDRAIRVLLLFYFSTSLCKPPQACHGMPLSARPPHKAFPFLIISYLRYSTLPNPPTPDEKIKNLIQLIPIHRLTKFLHPLLLQHPSIRNSFLQYSFFEHNIRFRMYPDGFT